MPISGKLFVWEEGANYAPEEPGVYVLYNKDRDLIYVGGSINIRGTFAHYLETNFSGDPRKRGTKYYRRKPTLEWKKRAFELLNEYNQKHGELPELNVPPDLLKEDVRHECGFYFYEDIDKSLFEVAFNLEDFREKIRTVPVSSLEFHQKRGDFARWIHNVLRKTLLAERIGKINNNGEDIRRELLSSLLK